MRPLSQSLQILITTAEELIQRPQLALSTPTPAFAELASEIRRIHVQPAEGARCTPAAIVMVESIEQFIAGPHEKTSPWLMLAGATLPLLRTAAWVAMNSERETR